MRFSFLLFVLFVALKTASITNRAFRKYIAKINARVLIKTADGLRARQFIFNRGRVSSAAGDCREFDVALIWKDAATGFSVMTDKRPDASFNAAAEGKLKVAGMSVYAQWFENGIKLVL
ncbi:MAG: hypothetical protein ACOZF0_11155 [Thermodesulfobacteriota bacterium]